ncbi:MAG: phage holin family protein [Telluria sp.]
MDHTSTTVHGPGLIGGLTGLAKNVFGLVVSRLELAALELTEVRDHALELAAIFAMAIICSLFAIAYGTAMIVALSWEALGWKILLIMFLVFIAIAAILVFKGKAMLRQGKLAFPETMNELRNDRDMLL